MTNTTARLDRLYNKTRTLSVRFLCLEDSVACFVEGGAFPDVRRFPTAEAAVMWAAKYLQIEVPA